MHRVQRLHRVHLEQLRRQRGGPALSLYLPTEATDPLAQAADLELLLEAAARSLEATGVGRSEREAMLGPFRELVSEIPFWTSWSIQNLTLFAAGGAPMFLRSPYRVVPRVSVEERFYLLPLLPILREDFHFYLLELGPRRLYSGDLYHLRELSPQELPGGLRAALAGGGCLAPLGDFAAGLPVVVAGPQAERARLELPGVAQRVEMESVPPERLAESAWVELRRWLNEDCLQALRRCTAGLQAREILRAAEAGEVEALVVGEPSAEANLAALAVLDAGGQVFTAPSGPLQAVLRTRTAARR